MAAVLVLGMQRSGTSALAGLLSAAGVASAGPSVRNWDNANGHFESLDLVRLNEAVLARSGGHWLAPPGRLSWTPEHELERDRLLAEPVDGRPALLKDPRTLLTLGFWRASPVPFRALGIVRHPLAVARSLAAWRGLPLAEGLALWEEHAKALLADHRAHGTALVDLDEPRDAFLARVASACRTLGVDPEPAVLEDAFEERLVHHDAEADDEDPPGLAAARELHGALVAGVGGARRAERSPFPRALLAAFQRELAAGSVAKAEVHAREALASSADPLAVLVPVTNALVRAGRHDEAARLVQSEARLAPAFGALLIGKLRIAAGDAAGALEPLTSVVDGPSPPHQARRLLALALHRAGRRADARARMREVASHALYPHDALAQLAEWSWAAGARVTALEELARAIEAAPPHRRGRLRTRRAEWLLRSGDRDGGRAELERARAEDPTYGRAREQLARLEGV